MNVSSTTLSPTLSYRYYPWLVITFSALFLFYKYILQVSPSVMTHQLMQAFQLHGAGMGNLTATYFYTYLVVQLFVGPLLDKYSLRNLTALAIAVCALSTFGFAYSHTIMQACVFRALMGVGVAFATVSYMKAAAIWFKPEQFAFVGGLLATAAMVGALFGQAPLAFLVAHSGWRNSLSYCGVGGLILAIAFFLFVQDKKSLYVPLLKEKEADFGLVFKDFWEMLKSKQNWLLTFYSGLAFSPIAVFGGLWGNAYLESAFDVTPTRAASLTSLVFLGLAVGSPILGLISDRINKRYPVMVIGLLISILGILVALYLPFLSLFWLGFFLFLFGFGTGSFMLSFAMGKERNKVGLAASVIALINTGDAIVGSFTDPLTGKLLDLCWDGKIVNGVHYFSAANYRVALSLLPLYLLAALGFLFLMNRRA